jgi:hypothetical protein
MGRALYVYAIVRSGIRLPRIPGHAIERVDIGTFAAVAERRRTARPLSEKTLRDQFRVVERLHERVDAILPVRFGAFVDEEELRRIVTLRRRALAVALRKVRKKSQMTVRLLGRPAARLPAAAAATGTQYLLARAESARPAVSPLAETIRRAVARLAAAEAIDPGRGSIELTLHHLVANGRVARYRDSIERTVADLNSRSAIVVSGPMPPFAFAPDLWNAT